MRLVIKFKAFSLIELMVVIAIVAILAAVAVPAYKTYMIRTYIIKDLDKIKSVYGLELINHYNTRGSLPGWGWSPPAGELTGPWWLMWDGGQIFFRYSGAEYQELENKQVNVIPSVDSEGIITWECSTPDSSTDHSMKCEYLPSMCQVDCTP